MSRRTVNSNLRVRNAPKKKKLNSQKRKSSRRNISIPLRQGSQMVFREPRQEIKAGECRIRHREPLGPLNGGAAFFLQEYALNPGMSGVFPWLSSIAAGYEMYKFNSINFQFLTTSASTFTGELIMAPNYNAQGIPPNNSQQLEQLQGFARTLVWKDMQCRLNPLALNNVNPKRYVRTGPVGLNSDIRLYDAGKFYVASQGQANNVQIGSLFVEYDVVLYTPKPNPLIMSAGAFENIGEVAWSVTPKPWFGPTPEDNAQVYGSFGFVADNTTQSCIISGLEPGTIYSFILLLACDSLSGTLDLSFESDLGFQKYASGNYGDGYSMNGILRPTQSFGTIEFVGSPTATVAHGTVIYIAELPEGAGQTLLPTLGVVGDQVLFPSENVNIVNKTVNKYTSNLNNNNNTLSAIRGLTCR